MGSARRVHCHRHERMSTLNHDAVRPAWLPNPHGTSSAAQLIASVVGDQRHVADASRGLAKQAAHLVPLRQDHFGAGAIDGSYEHSVGAPAFNGYVAIPGAAGAVYFSVHLGGP